MVMYYLRHAEFKNRQKKCLQTFFICYTKMILLRYFIHLLEIEFTMLVISHNLNYFKKMFLQKSVAFFPSADTVLQLQIQSYVNSAETDRFDLHLRVHRIHITIRPNGTTQAISRKRVLGCLQDQDLTHDLHKHAAILISEHSLQFT